ncbi:MAG: TonB-dependent receptor [Verrucomicrobiota bacterium]
MNIPNLFRCVLGALIALAFAMPAQAQVVSAGITGMVRDTAGTPVPNASVVIVHTPTNATSTAITNQFGRFAVRGLPVGGPFTVTANADSYSPATANNVLTELAQDAEVSLTLKGSVVVMEKFVASASRSDLDATATGSGTTIDALRISRQPTVNRSFADLMRTNPYVTSRAGGDRMTALGMNNRFNSISVDGARINDSFGLNASGLFSVNNPFAMEALEAFSVDLSPYDVSRSGFTGASVNAVTKSGTNQFHGSAYYITTNDDLQGRDLIGANAGGRIYSDEITKGFTLGGPIIKNRLFFFLNWDDFERKGTSVTPVFTPNAADFATISTRLTAISGLAAGNPNFGTISGGANLTTEEKKLAKVDWNINADHRLSVRYSETVGSQPAFGGLNSTAFSGGAALTGAPSIGRIAALTSNFYSTDRTEEVWAGQIFSNWSPNLKTQIGYSKVDKLQDSISPVAFPEVRIYGVPGTDANTGAAVSNGVIVFGTENSRHGNKIEDKSQSYSAKADYTWGRFTFTAGADREEAEYVNLFRQSSYGVLGYTNVAAFVADQPFAFTRALVQTGFPVADISEYEQTAIFGQLKMDVSSRFNFTVGLRYDWMGSPIPPTENVAFRTAFGRTNAGTIDDTSLLAPRAGFNYSFDDDRTVQLRGGVGTILGRAPWVWISNAYGGTGVGRFSQSLSTLSTPPTVPAPPTLASYLATGFDPANPVGTSASAPPASAAAISLTQPGLHLPSVIRGNLAIDTKLRALGANLTLEYIHTEVKDSLFIENINLRPTTVGADGRQRFAGGAAAQPRIAGFQNVLLLRNVKDGGSRYFSIQVDKPSTAQTLGWNFAYTRGSSKEAQNMGSSTAGSTWQFNAVFNQGAVEVERSDFEIRDRVIFGLQKQFKYWRDMKTTFSLFYEGRTGSPYSWVYSNDLNGDGFNGNDVVTVPTGASDARFDFTNLSAAQVAGYLRFFGENDMSQFSGSYAKKNSFVQPWQNRLDLRVEQEIRTVGPVKIKLFADFLNFGSWLNDDVFNYIETLPIPTNTGLVRNAPAATYNAAGRIVVTPAGSFDAANNVIVPANSAIAINNGDSRWRIQLGVHLQF